MPKVKEPHIHKFKWMNIGRKNNYFVYKCMLPDCSTYYPVELAVGRETLCWGGYDCCEGNVVITSAMMNKPMVHPVCGSCREMRKKIKEALSVV